MDLKIGTILTLEPTYTERVEKFRCRVVEQGENIIYIDYPVNVVTKKTSFLVDGAQFRVTFMAESKQGFAFNTEVLGRKGGTVPMIILSCPSPEEFLKIQRREYVRVETKVDVSIEYDGRFTPLVTEDLSAGGLAVILSRPVNFREGDEVKLTIVLPYSNGDIKYVQTSAVIVRIFEKGEIRLASIQFTNTDDIDKQHIVRLCFERQLQLRKKELNETI
jgi:c-di-GMP-binding flagellar brake protein YcgR